MRLFQGVILPHPCDGPFYHDWSTKDWMLKVCEECGEAVEAHKLLERAIREKAPQEEVAQASAHLYQELTDVITAATSALDFMGCDFEMRQIIQKQINESNGKRDGGRRFRKEW